MTRQARISLSLRISESSELIAAYGTPAQREHRAHFLAYGRTAAVLALADRIRAARVPASEYALSA